MSSSRPTSRPVTTSTGDTVWTFEPLPIGESDWIAGLDKTAAKPSGASTQRVIPEKCEYARGMLIPGAPKVPLSPKTAADHPDLMVAAQRKIRSFVAANYHRWPACPVHNRNVDIDWQYDHDPQAGAVLIGFFQCEGCAR